MNRFVLGDPHGGYRALIQVLKKSGFNYKKDLLICLGDVADGWSEVPECFDELLKIKNLIYIMGNHCYWLFQYLRCGATPHIWTSQGGKATLDAYIRCLDAGDTLVLKRHESFLQCSKMYHLTEDNKLFVHGGLDWHVPIKDNYNNTLMWDRKAYETALMWERQDSGYIFKDYDEIYVGHTDTSHTSIIPVHAANLWNMDQGAGWKGRLSLQNIDTKEFWQSDDVYTLYPKDKGRY